MLGEELVFMCGHGCGAYLDERSVFMEQELVFTQEVFFSAKTYMTALPAAKTAAELAAATFFVAVISTLERRWNRQHFLCAETNLMAAISGFAGLSEESEHAKNQMALKLVHDLKTPIFNIAGLLKLVRKEQYLGKETCRCLDGLELSVGHLQRLLSNMLEFSRLVDDGQARKKKTFVAEELIENCVLMVKGQFAEKKTKFCLDFPETRKEAVYGDEFALRQILMNLLTNAVKFTPKEGKVTVRLRKVPILCGKVRYIFDIEDTGVGISREFQERIFEPFAQENDKSGGRGVGLGLTIVKEYMDQLGGSILIKSCPGKGTRFTLILPFDKGESRQTEEKPKMFFPVDVRTNLQGMKVLLAEDDPISRDVMRRIVGEWGASVVVVENGKQAVELFKASRNISFDAVLMDLVMPVMNGIEATTQIQKIQMERHSNVPVLILSGNESEREQAAALQAGAETVLMKPLNYGRLQLLLEGIRLRKRVSA